MRHLEVEATVAVLVANQVLVVAVLAKVLQALVVEVVVPRVQVVYLEIVNPVAPEVPQGILSSSYRSLAVAVVMVMVVMVGVYLFLR